MLKMNSGSLISGKPSLGSWVNYGLGNINENLPGYVVMLDKTWKILTLDTQPVCYPGPHTRTARDRRPCIHDSMSGVVIDLVGM